MPTDKQNLSNEENNEMSDKDNITLEQVSEVAASAAAEAVNAALKAQKEAEEAQLAAEEARKNEISEAVKAEREKWEKEAAENRRLPWDGSGAPYVGHEEYREINKFDHLSAGEAALAAGLVKAFGQEPSGALKKAAAVKALEDKESPYVPSDSDGTIQDSRLLLKAQGLRDVDTAAKVKANEAVYSTSSGYGDEWVTVQYSNALWPVIRQGNPILEMMDRYSVVVPQGAESIQFHLESTDPTWYLVAQATATSADGPDATVTSSRIGTANKSLTVSKLGARVPYTGEAEEDSIIPLVPQIMDQIVTSGREYLASAIIDGDTATTASTNINDIAGTPAATDWFLAMNGFRKLALVTNTANSRDGGALTVQDYLENLYLMGAGGKNAYNAMGAVAFVQDPNVNKMSLLLPEVKTRDVFSNPTIERGLLTGIWGYPVITSYNAHRASLVNTGYEYKTYTDGKIDVDTAANNTKGALLSVRWDQWRLGYKRRITLENTRWAYADLNEIVAMMRVGLAYRDTEASAISYNLTV